MWEIAAMAAVSALYGEHARTNASKTPPTARKPAPSKCESCGSREWTAHDGKEVCSYCRSDR